MQEETIVTETHYAQRTDTVDDKLRLLRKAHRDGNLDVALSLADSIKDTLSLERQGRVDIGDTPLDAANCADVEQLPPVWAKWAQGWRHYKSLSLAEGVGLERRAEPVELWLECLAEQATDLRREVRVVRLSADDGRLREIASQICAQVYQEGRRACRLLFLADVPAGGEAHYLIFFGNPDAELPDYGTDLQVSGEGYGLEIANNHFTAHLSQQMGQLQRLAFRRGHGDVPYGAPLELVTGGEGHGEPPNIDWGPDYYASENFQKFRVTAWSQCPNYEVIRGPLAVQIRRWGFPHSPVHPLFTPSRCHMSLSYTFYAGHPYFLKEVRMETVKAFETTTIRDDEWLFWGRPFTDGLWLDGDGVLHEGDVPDGSGDDMWGVGFFNRDSRDAFVALRLQHEGVGLGPLQHGGAPSTNYYGRGQIWCRTPLPGPTRLEPGAVLLQRSAFLATHYPEDGGAQCVEEARRRLVNPLVARASSLPRRPKTRAGGALARFGEARRGSPASIAVDCKHRVWRALREVRDDQLYTSDGGNVADLGYIYDVRVTGDVVHILMTMPHRGRPQHNFLANPIRDRVQQLEGVRDCVVEVTWEPAWTVARLTAAGRRAVGLE